MRISPIGIYGASSAAPSIPFKVGMPGEPPPVHVPAGMDIRRRVMRDLGIEILDSDVKFEKAELLIVEAVLKDIKKRKREHLRGVKEIVKNKELKVRLLNGALIHAGGAYVAEQKRVYIFDELPEEKIPEVLIHEVGHAVNHFNLSFETFKDFVKNTGWSMTEMRSVFYDKNKYFQFGTKKLDIPDREWDKVWDRFSLNSLIKEQDVFGEIVLKLPHKTKYPWDENPLEKFAWAYEWFYEKNETFRKIAEEAKQEGDPTLAQAYSFMEKEVFGQET